MKSAIICFILIVATIVLLAVVLFFRDRVLFFMAGYDYELTKGTSVESFKAHAVIQKWRLALVGLTFLVGAICTILCRNMSRVSDSWYYTAGKFLGIITCIIMVVFLFMYMILPKRLL
jgi:hypothetical protein